MLYLNNLLVSISLMGDAWIDRSIVQKLKVI